MMESMSRVSMVSEVSEFTVDHRLFNTLTRRSRWSDLGLAGLVEEDDSVHDVQGDLGLGRGASLFAGDSENASPSANPRYRQRDEPEEELDTTQPEVDLSVLLCPVALACKGRAPDPDLHLRLLSMVEEKGRRRTLKKVWRGWRWYVSFHLNESRAQRRIAGARALFLALRLSTCRVQGAPFNLWASATGRFHQYDTQDNALKWQLSHRCQTLHRSLIWPYHAELARKSLMDRSSRLVVSIWPRWRSLVRQAQNCKRLMKLSLQQKQWHRVNLTFHSWSLRVQWAKRGEMQVVLATRRCLAWHILLRYLWVWHHSHATRPVVVSRFVTRRQNRLLSLVLRLWRRLGDFKKLFEGRGMRTLRRILVTQPLRSSFGSWRRKSLRLRRIAVLVDVQAAERETAKLEGVLADLGRKEAQLKKQLTMTQSQVRSLYDENPRVMSELQRVRDAFEVELQAHESFDRTIVSQQRHADAMWSNLQRVHATLGDEDDESVGGRTGSKRSSRNILYRRSGCSCNCIWWTRNWACRLLVKLYLRSLPQRSACFSDQGENKFPKTRSMTVAIDPIILR